MNHVYNKLYSLPDILDAELDFPNALSALLGFSNYLNRLIVNTPRIADNGVLLDEVRTVMFRVNELQADYAQSGHFKECHDSVESQMKEIIKVYSDLLGMDITFTLCPRREHAHHAVEYRFNYEILGQMGRQNTDGHFNIIAYKPVMR